MPLVACGWAERALGSVIFVADSPVTQTIPATAACVASTRELQPDVTFLSLMVTSPIHISRPQGRPPLERSAARRDIPATAELRSGPVTYASFRVHTRDGMELSLFRSHPAGLTVSKRPVLLLHGVASNRFGFGLSEAVNLPRFLNARGRDVWLLEFRGCRSSRDLLERRPAPVDVDRMLSMDLPAAVERVLSMTGATEVDLVGHSLGGLLTYLYLGASPNPRVARAVTLSAPWGLGYMLPVLGRRLLRRPAGRVRPLLSRLSGVGLPKASRMRGPVGHLVMLRQHARFLNTDRRLRRTFLDHAVEDMPGTFLAQLMDWVVDDRMTSVAGSMYEDLPGKVSHPVRVIACQNDRVVPPSAARAGFEALNSDERDFVVIGKRHGGARDYGHMDMLMAPTAVEDIYPQVAQWLER